MSDYSGFVNDEDSDVDNRTINFNFESTSIVWSKAYILDLNVPARKPIFEVSLVDVTPHEFNFNKFKYASFDTREALNEHLNHRVKEHINCYGLWSDADNLKRLYNNFEFLPQDFDYETNMQELAKPVNSTIKKRTFLSAQSAEQNELRLLEPNSQFLLTDDAIKELGKMESLDGADQFLNTFGTHYPVSTFSMAKLRFLCCEVCSYEIDDERVLKSIGEKLIAEIDHTYNPIESGIYIGNSKNNDPNYNDYMGQIKAVELPPLYKSELTDQHDEIRWKPIWQLISTAINNHSITEQKINLVKAAFLIRHLNYVYLKSVVNTPERIEQLNSSINFRYSDYWHQSVFGYINRLYQVSYIEHFFSKNKMLTLADVDFYTNFITNCFGDFYNREQISFKSMVNQSRIYFLGKSTGLDYFTELYSNKNNFLLIYYNHDLIKQDHNLWMSIIKKVQDYLRVDELQNLYNPTLKTTMGVLIDYDIHDYLEHKPFYKKCLYIEYFFDQGTNEGTLKIEEQQNVRLVDFSNKKLMAFNDLRQINVAKGNFLKIDLKKNYLISLNYYTFPATILKNIIEIDLSKNMIEALDTNALSGLVNLKKLNLSGNFLTKIKSTHFSCNIRLEKLDLSHNQIESIEPKSFNILFALKVLYLDNNNLTSIPNDLFDSDRRDYELKKLNLSHNRLYSIANKTFSKLSKLERLELDNNKLLAIKNYYFENLHNLEYLFLNSNKISFVEDGSLEPLNSLRGIFLFENSFSNEFRFMTLMKKTEFAFPDQLVFFFRKEQVENCVNGFKKYFKISVKLDEDEDWKEDELVDDGDDQNPDQYEFNEEVLNSTDRTSDDAESFKNIVKLSSENVKPSTSKNATG